MRATAEPRHTRRLTPSGKCVGINDCRWVSRVARRLLTACAGLDLPLRRRYWAGRGLSSGFAFLAGLSHEYVDV